MSDRNPLLIYCHKCNAPVGYDIIHSTYRCKYCGETSDYPGTEPEFVTWKELNKDTKKTLSVEEKACPSCSSTIVFQTDEVSEVCDFCGSKLIRKEFTQETFPNRIIPFVLTQEEAKEQLKKWAIKNNSKVESKMILSHLDQITGYYLPYYMIKGPVDGSVYRYITSRKFHVKGYLEGSLVNANEQLDNEVLDKIEPFDWNEIKPFDLGYISGLKVKVCDLDDEEMKNRALEETKNDFLPTIEKVMQTTGIHMNLTSNDFFKNSLLLPIYFVKDGSFLAVVNGQTGRVAVSTKKKKKTYPWILDALISTVITTIIFCFAVRFEWHATLLLLMFFLLLFFSFYSIRGDSFIQRIIYQSKASKAKRKNEKISYIEENNILKNPFDNTPIFVESVEGKDVPVRIKYYHFERWISVFIQSILFIFAPIIIAAIIRFIIISFNHQDFMSQFNLVSATYWGVFGFILSFAYCVGRSQKDFYEKPYFYQILDDGKLKLIGKGKDYRISFISVLKKDYETGKTNYSTIVVMILMLILTVLSILI